MHHHHGQQHTDHSAETYHHHDHGDLINAILEMQSTDEENEEHPAPAIILLHEHLNIRQIDIHGIYNNNQDYLNAEADDPQQYISQPEVPPPMNLTSFSSLSKRFVIYI